jgi:hypothetical protein
MGLSRGLENMRVSEDLIVPLNPHRVIIGGIWEFVKPVENLMTFSTALWKTFGGIVKILYECLTNRYTAGLHDYKILYLQ